MDQVGRFEEQVEAKVEKEVDVDCLVVEVEEAGGVKDAGVGEDVGEGEEEGNGGRAAHPDLVDAQKETVEKSQADQEEGWAAFAFGGI